MNSADKRIEATLNRGGQTISDLPEPNESSFAYSGKLEEAYSAALKFSKGEEVKEYGYTELMLSDYIMHLTDVIDRFEWALENTCNERDYLAYRLNWLSMYRHRDCQSCERVYECKRTPDHCLGWVFGGVPEDWRVDDE